MTQLLHFRRPHSRSLFPGAGSGAAPSPGVAIPAGLLANQNLRLLGDSRVDLFTGIRPTMQQACEKIDGTVVESGSGGYSLRQVNGFGGTDHVAECLEGAEAVIFVVVGYNDLGALDLAAMQADLMAILKRLNAVKVAVTGESGTFARDTSGAHADWGDACSDGAGGAGVVTHVDGAGHVWLSEFSGLADGDVITCANSGYQATLAEDPPAHSGRLVAVASEMPASTYSISGAGQVHKDYADWIDTEPFASLSLAEFRAVDAKSDCLGTPDAERPIPYRDFASGDGIHATTCGGGICSATAGRDIAAMMENYTQVFPVPGAPPAGITDLSSHIPFTGAAGGLPTGWTAQDAAHPFATYSQIGADGDEDREVRIELVDPTNTLVKAAGIEAEMQPWTLTPVDIYLRVGVQVKITNAAGDGPPVGAGNFSTVGIQLLPYQNGWRASLLRYGDAFYDGWRNVMLPDQLVPGGTGGKTTLRLYALHESGPVDIAIHYRRPRVWQFPA